MKKFILIWLATIILAGAGTFAVQKYFPGEDSRGIEVVVQPVRMHDSVSATSTEGWKTYRNEKYGFEIRYPAKFIFSEKDYSSEQFAVAYETTIENADGEKYFHFEIWNKDGESLNDWLKVMSISLDIVKRNLNGISGFEASGLTDEGHGFVDDFYFERDNFIYKLQLNGLLEKNVPNDKRIGADIPILSPEIYNQILSTFKFIEPKNGVPADSTNGKAQCISSEQCEQGYSCLYKLPRGPAAGIPGSKDQPGQCVSDEFLQQIY